MPKQNVQTLTRQSSLPEDSYIVDLPRIIPPSPEEASLHAAIKYPVVGNTGVPDISIPLYTIKHGKISIPITLRYSTSNVKIDESVRPNVAFGWVLDFGGSINRTVKGKPDEKHLMYPLNSDSPSSLRFDQLNRNQDNKDRKLISRIYSAGIIGGINYDSEYDNFSFVHPGGSGSFYIKRKDSNDILSPLTAYFSPNYNYKSEYINRQFELINSIGISDGKGTTYNYGGTIPSSYIEFANYESDIEVSTAWMLSDITDDTGNKVQYFYKEGAATHSKYPILYEVMDDFKYYCNYPSGTGKPEWLINDHLKHQPNSPYARVYETPQVVYSFRKSIIDYIDFGEGTIVFSTDEKHSISGVEVRDRNNNLIKRIIFNKVNNNISPSSKLLQSIEVQNSNGNTVQTYVMDYQNKRHAPEVYGYISYDHWGYFNRQSQHYMGLLPNRTFSLMEYMSAAPLQMTCGNNGYREPDPELILHNVLKSITYPMGGKTEFAFEPNSYSKMLSKSLGKEYIGSGLRIKEIVHKDTDGSVLEKLGYMYGTGTIPMVPTRDDLHPGSITATTTYLLNLVYELYHLGREVPPWERFYYATLERLQLVSPSFNSFAIWGGETICYDKVEEMYYNNSIPSGKRIQYFEIPDNVQFTRHYANEDELFGRAEIDYTWLMMHIAAESQVWEESRVTRTDVFDNRDTLVQRTRYFYAEAEKEKLWNMGFYKLFSYSINTGDMGGRDMLLDYGAMDALKEEGCSEGFPPLMYFFYTSSKGVVYPSGEETEYFYKDGTSFKQQKAISYTDLSGSHHYPRKIREQTSGGEALERELKYPFDYNNGILNAMVEQNIVSPVVDEKVFVKHPNGNSDLLEHRSLSYAGFPGSSTAQFYRPSELYELKNAGDYPSAVQELEVRYDRYDSKGNLLQYTGRDGVPISYLWGYNSTYPIVQAVGVTYDELQQAAGNDVQSYTTYIVLKNLFDNLRSRLKNAQITGYSYRPLVGMETETGPDGLTTYYEYDTFGRLFRVLDHNRKVVKQYEYNYYTPENL